MSRAHLPRLPCSIAPLVPHSRGMCLLQTLQEADDHSAVAETVTQRDDPFAEAAGIPAWVGIEWLAQAVAAWAGFHARMSGESPAPGLLLGSRRYSSHRPYFPFDRTVRVFVTVDFVADNGVTQVNGQLCWADDPEPLAEGSLTLYRPDTLPMNT